jgi:predicted Zn-dependent protease
VAVKRIALIAFVALISLGCTAAKPKSPIPVPPLPVGRSVFFAPVGEFPREDAEALAAHYNEKFGMAIGILPSLALPREAYDLNRRQVVAERVLDAVVATYGQAAGPASVVIVLVDRDMYIADSTWKFAYGLRDKGHLAVVSTAHLDDGLLGNKTQRLQKMVTKDIGILYFGLPQSDDPKSVLYKNVLGPLDLDRMSEDF